MIECRFHCRVFFADRQFPICYGSTKKLAKERAALQALDLLVKSKLLQHLNAAVLSSTRVGT